MAQIHPSAVVDPSAVLADDVVVGPFCVVGAHVTLGKGCVLHNHVTLYGYSTFGERNEFFANCVIGQKSMDLKYKGEPTCLEVGNDNVFREGVTISRSTEVGGKTVIGDRNYFLVNSHAGHDCQVGNDNVISGFAGLAGHVIVGDCTVIGGFAAIHQFVRVGSYVMVGGVARVVKDLPPYTMIEGAPAAVRGLNIVGLQRRGFSEEDIRSLKTAYKVLFLHRDQGIEAAMETLREKPAAQNEHVIRLMEFISEPGRGITR